MPVIRKEFSATISPLRRDFGPGAVPRSCEGSPAARRNGSGGRNGGHPSAERAQPTGTPAFCGSGLSCPFADTGRLKERTHYARSSRAPFARASAQTGEAPGPRPFAAARRRTARARERVRLPHMGPPDGPRRQRARRSSRCSTGARSPMRRFAPRSRRSTPATSRRSSGCWTPSRGCCASGSPARKSIAGTSASTTFATRSCSGSSPTTRRWPSGCRPTSRMSRAR